MQTSPAPTQNSPSNAILLRSHQPGDIGWAIEQHARIYADEYGFDAQFEALVADILSKFLRDFDPQAERCWIAEMGGVRVGCVFVVRHAERHDVAQLRCLIVHPTARGLGLGQRLTRACIAFAREAGYTRMMLWTNAMLTSARHIYKAAGFKLVREEAHHSFGQSMVGQYWELAL